MSVGDPKTTYVTVPSLPYAGVNAKISNGEDNWYSSLAFGKSILTLFN